MYKCLLVELENYSNNDYRPSFIGMDLDEDNASPRKRMHCHVDVVSLNSSQHPTYLTRTILFTLSKTALILLSRLC
jgi:hypothetical protein